MVHVLVVSASRHGSTHDVAERVAGELSLHGHDVHVREVPDTTAEDIEAAEAVVIGSGVYRGRWLDEAVLLVRAHAELLEQRAVWLFSTGPAGEGHRAPPLLDLAELVATCDPRGHRTFGGRVQRDLLSLRERVSAEVLRLAEGDHRDLEAVHRWAAGIAADLKGVTHRTPLSGGPR